MQNKISCLISLIFFTLSVCGCATIRTLKSESSLVNKTIVVVPFKGPAISIANGHMLTFVLFGFVGSNIEGALGAPERRSICDQFNRALPAFVPERILAEEFVGVLQNSGQREDQMVAIYKDTVIMKGALPLINSLSYPFTSEFGFSKIMQWNGVISPWWKSKPGENYSITEMPLDSQIILEVVPYTMTWANNKVIEIILFARLVDPVSGVVLASNEGPGLIENGAVRPLKSIEESGNLVEDFRNVARKAAEKCLKQLKIVN